MGRASERRNWASEVRKSVADEWNETDRAEEGQDLGGQRMLLTPLPFPLYHSNFQKTSFETNATSPHQSPSTRPQHDMSAQVKASPAPPASALLSNPLFARYLRSLQANPLATKQLTSGIFSALAEVLAGHLAGLSPASAAAAKGTAVQSTESSSSVRNLPGVALAQDALLRLGINDRALKMFVYGWAVSAPMGHVLTGEWASWCRTLEASQGERWPRRIHAASFV